MSNHSDKIYNGLCVECLSNYSRILNEKQSEINKLVEEMKNLTFPHLEVTMIARDQIPKLQVENTRDDLLNNIFINKNIKEELREEIENVIPKKKIGRPKKIKIEEVKNQPKFDSKKVEEAKKVLLEQQELAEKEKVVILDIPLYPKRTRGRGKSLKTLEKEKALNGLSFKDMTDKQRREKQDIESKKNRSAAKLQREKYLKEEEEKKKKEEERQKQRDLDELHRLMR